MLFEAENPKVRLMADLNKIYVANREFSYEEIRRQIYERNGRYAGTITAQMKDPLPVTPKVLPAVEPETRLRAPCKRFDPNQYLKSNERLHCNTELIFMNGTEVSFEQVRAQFYKSRLTAAAVESPRVAATVVEPPRIAATVVETPTCVAATVVETRARIAATTEPARVADPTPPPATLTVQTCEIGVQTDLFGLDYDILLVPRKSSK